MRGAYAIARHEFVRRLLLIPVGMAVGVVAIVFAEPDPLGYTEFGDTLITIAVVLGWIVSFTTGMQLLGRPLHDGRLSFYFTRPITSSGIAIGKVAGALLAITCMHVALLLPLEEAFVTHEGDGTTMGAATFVGLAFFVVGLVVGILARSRSRWFLADVVGAGTAAVVAVATFGTFGVSKSTIAQMETPLAAQAQLARADTYLYALAVIASVALLVSVVVGITRGRTDRDLVHRWISVTLWPALIATGVAGIGLARWGLQ